MYFAMDNGVLDKVNITVDRPYWMLDDAKSYFLWSEMHITQFSILGQYPVPPVMKF